MIVKTNGTQKESKIMDFVPKQAHMLHYDVENDTTKPEATVRTFVGDIKNMLARYEGNKTRIFQIEEELNDLEHYMEIGNFKNVPEGYKLYRKLAELRRERRACKNENFLLKPIYEHFYATEVLNKLSYVQGECAKIKNTIDARAYTVRTDILDEWLEPEKKEPQISEKPVRNDVDGNLDGAGDQVTRDIIEGGSEMTESEKKEKIARLLNDRDKKFVLAWQATN